MALFVESHPRSRYTSPRGSPVAASKAIDPLIGKTLGNYKILRELGRGGMGVVYRGKQVSVKRDVAIKVLSLALAHDRSFVKRFVREGRIAGRLTHPNIVTIHDVGEQDGTYFIVMEYVRGKTLDAAIKAEGQFEVEKALKLTKSIAAALAEAHKHGIIHRDIKPQNVMHDEKGIVKVMDFGLARRMTSTSNLTVTGAVLGTPKYMSPEQCRGEEVDVRTDIYSLGVVLFEMLTGRPPHESDSPLGLIMKTIELPFPVAGHFNPRVTTAVDELVADMVAKDVRKRYVSAAAVATEIDRILSSELATAPSTERVDYGDSRTAQAKVGALDGPAFDQKPVGTLENLEIRRSPMAYPVMTPGGRALEARLDKIKSILYISTVFISTIIAVVSIVWLIVETDIPVLPIMILSLVLGFLGFKFQVQHFFG